MLETLLLLHFCSEGNNISEGIIIASAANLVVDVLDAAGEGDAMRAAGLPLAGDVAVAFGGGCLQVRCLADSARADRA